MLNFQAKCGGAIWLFVHIMVKTFKMSKILNYCTQIATRTVINIRTRLAKKNGDVSGKVKHIASTLISEGTKRALEIEKRMLQAIPLFLQHLPMRINIATVKGACNNSTIKIFGLFIVF